MNITEETNFCRVFELPEVYPNDYCFGGGLRVQFKMIDWFKPVYDIEEANKMTWEEYVPTLKGRLIKKNYVKENKPRLLVTDFDESMIFKKGASHGRKNTR